MSGEVDLIYRPSAATSANVHYNIGYSDTTKTFLVCRVSSRELHFLSHYTMTQSHFSNLMLEHPSAMKRQRSSTGGGEETW